MKKLISIIVIASTVGAQAQTFRSFTDKGFDAGTFDSGQFANVVFFPESADEFKITVFFGSAFVEEFFSLGSPSFRRFKFPFDKKSDKFEFVARNLRTNKETRFSFVRKGNKFERAR